VSIATEKEPVYISNMARKILLRETMGSWAGRAAARLGLPKTSPISGMRRLGPIDQRPDARRQTPWEIRSMLVGEISRKRRSSDEYNRRNR